MHELPAGPDAVVLDFSADDSPSAAVLAATEALRGAVERGELPEVTDLVPSAHTLLVQAGSGRGLDELGVRRALRRRRPGGDDARVSDEIVVPVVYDGADLADVAATLEMTTAEVIGMHCRTRWRVQFMGFAPGFGYLVADDGETPHPFEAVGRRHEARTHVPRGSVAIAAGYSAVYPRSSPGGWQLLGRTDVRLWDENSDPPALFTTGRVVRFVDAGRDHR